VQLAAVVEYLNISGLVIDFATSSVRTGNSFFVAAPAAFAHCLLEFRVLSIITPDVDTFVFYW